MQNRDRLIKLCDTNCGYVDEVPADKFADYLIENGVMALPCKVGDTVYTILLGEIISYDIASYIIDERISFVNLAFMQGNKMYGKTVTIKEFYEHYYFTKEEAEKALKERDI